MQPLRNRARELRNNATDAERHLWRYLRGRQIEGFRFRRQVPIAGYIADFVCPQAMLIVELDGGQHAERVEYDAARTARLRQQGYRVLRYWNHDVLLRTEDVVADIHRELTKSFTPPQPSPSPAAKGREQEQQQGQEQELEKEQELDLELEQELELEQACCTPSLSPQAKGRAGEGCS